MLATIFIIVTPTNVVALGWTSPNGFSDPGNEWTDEAKAYDSSTSTYASNNFGGLGWGQFLYLTLSSSILSDRVRMYSDFGYGYVDYIDVDVYKNSAWTDVWQGAILDCSWDVKTFSPGLVTQARFRYHYAVGGAFFWLYEFQFYEMPPVVNPPTGETLAATSIEEDRAILHGKITDDGGGPSTWRFQYGTTTAYGTATPWANGKVTNEIFSKGISGLNNGVTYHYMAQVKNSAGTDNGADMMFTTGPAPAGWVSPTESTDVTTRWVDQELAYDDNTNSWAKCYHLLFDPTGEWSPFLYLSRKPVSSDTIRFYARGMTTDQYRVDSVDVGVFKDGTWVDVYQGSFVDKQWVEYNFAPGLVSSARIRFHVNSAATGLYFELYEFDFYNRYIDAIVNLKPETLNLNSMGNFVHIMVEDFPNNPEYSPTQVDGDSVEIEGIGVDLKYGTWNDNKFHCKADRLLVEDAIGGPSEEAELTITGDVAITSFMGTCTIKAIQN